MPSSCRFDARRFAHNRFSPSTEGRKKDGDQHETHAYIRRCQQRGGQKTMAIGSAQLPASRIQVLGMLPLQQKFGLMVAIAAIVALLAGGWMWGQTPDYRVLYANP